MLTPFLRKLAAHSPLSAADRAALAALPAGELRVHAREFIVYEGARLSRSVLLLEGFAARYKLLPDGGRQILSLHVAGDIVDLHSAILKVADHSITAFGPARVAYLPHDALLGAIDASPSIARALWRDALIDAAITREWLLNVGRRDAYARMAHLFCELALRLEAVGLCQDGRFPLPLTQAELADTTGLTPVHVNRTLQRMRTDGLISTRGVELCIEDWGRLADVGSFDPAYLYLGAAATPG
jgi:CRP-like cAMP-binding protein